MKIIEKVIILSIISIPFVFYFNMSFPTEVTYMKFVLLILYLSLIFLVSLFRLDLKNKKKLLKIIFPILLLSCLVTIYYFFFSVKIEPLVYLHNKYKINYSDLKIIDTTRYHSPFLCLNVCHDTYREATVKYKGIEFKTFYKVNNWNDDYSETIEFNNKESEITQKVNTILKKYSDIYIFNKNVLWQWQYSFNIFIYSKNENSIRSLTSELDNYIKNERTNIRTYTNYSLYNASLYITYNLYITKDKNLYNLIAGSEKISIADSNANYTLPIITGLTATRITSVKGYDSTVFTNNGNTASREYQDINNFKHIIFCYSSEPNRIPNHQDFNVFGLK